MTVFKTGTVYTIYADYLLPGIGVQILLIRKVMAGELGPMYSLIFLSIVGKELLTEKHWLS
jgi:hypothetical protein